jgi:hypothetical protein
MSRRRFVWMVATKVAFTLAVMLPSKPRNAVEYRVLSALSGVRAGTPVILAGQLIGEVVATNRRGDTTFLHVRFNRGAERLSGSRSVALWRMGLAQDVALEILLAPRRDRGSFARGGWLRVLPPVLEERPWPEQIPTVPAAPRRLPPALT